MSKVQNTDSPADFGASTTFNLSLNEGIANQRFMVDSGEKSAADGKSSTAEASLQPSLSNQAWLEVARALNQNALDQETQRCSRSVNFDITTEVKSLLNGFELVAYVDDGSGTAYVDIGSGDPPKTGGSTSEGSADSATPDKTAASDNRPAPFKIPPVFGTPEEQEADAPLKDQPKQEADPRFEALKKRIAAADQIDPKLAINDVLAGQLHSVDLIETLTKTEIASKDNKPLLEVAQGIDQQKFNSYVAYLSPATTRADLALARIATGDAEQVKQGEKGLIEALRLRPELQFNAELQNATELAFKMMAESRQKAGLPPLGTANSVVSSFESSTSTKPDTGIGTGSPGTATGIVDGAKAYEKLGRASQLFQEKGMEGAAPLFQQAISESDKLDQKAMTEQRLQLFARKLELGSQIAEATVQGKNTDSLKGLHQKVAEREWESYKNYLGPASIRTNTAMAMIASGNVQSLVEAKKLLAEAIQLRPELEFSKDYQEHLKRAFQAHNQNKPLIPTENVDGQANKTSTAEKQIDVKPDYKPFDAEKKTTQVPEIANEPEMERYLADRLTGPVLTAGLLYLGYRSVKSQYNRRLERVRVARLGDLLRVSDSETSGEDKPTERKIGDNKTTENKSADNKPADKKAADDKTPHKPDEPVRPKRRVVDRENLSRDGIEIAQDGTRTFTNAQGELMKLSWRERLTDTEMQELEKTRKDLERRVEKGEKLSKEDSRQLDALNHFEKNKFDAKLHKKVVEAIEKSRPEGGFRARDAVGPAIGIAIVTSAIVGYYLNSRGEKQEEPLKRAKFNDK
jgi:hypothetical protein